ncbi:adenine phosphoribosyltransferase [Methylonatrum kenyense]|uniref:phosphoribosyltransferase family protein n=1 Tax=Methylonatrum kenyense TaxID=455253 RepID=UPI0020BE5964|nr:phosphoribosyltransferase family protein [Methylonatrum kenyense]MCK8516571.1 adenine phosphoribosyltransferase [Methylonatrum kenyense]
MSASSFRLNIGTLQRELPLFEVAPGVRIAVLNILGDPELTEAAADALAEQLRAVSFDVLLTAEAKSIPLIHALALRCRKASVVLRKAWKPYMGNALQATTLSITSGREQRLYLDQKDREVLRGQRVLLLDDVISTGSTLAGMRELVEQAGGRVVGTAAICTEGDVQAHDGVIALAHLPVFSDSDASSR